MKSRTTIALIIVLTIATLLMCISTFSLLAAHGNVNMDKMLIMLAINIPLGLLVVFVDYIIISSRQLIVNISSVVKSTRLFGGRMKVYLKPECPHEATVSRSRVADFVRWLDDSIVATPPPAS